MNNVTASSENLNTNENGLLEYAKSYVEDGLTIIPLDENAQPLLSDWEKYKYADTCATFEDVRQWVSKWPNLKWGLATGNGSRAFRGINLVVIHVKPGGDEDRWPATVCSEAEDGGTYLFFMHPGFLRPASVKVRSAKDFLPNTDVIGEDDYVVIQSQPFAHNASWINYFGEIDIAQIPDDILPLILEDPDYVMSDVPEGVQIPEMFNTRDELETRPLEPITRVQNKLRVWTIGEILTHDFGPEEWLVKSLITKQGITAFSGNPGDYKTWITIHIALCVARNASVFGKFATTQGSVLIIDEEDHIRVVKGRLELLGAEDTDAIHYLSQSGFKADNEKALQAVVDFVKEKNIKLVILDSLVRIHQQEENDATGMAKVFSSIQKIIAAGASILFTHHHRKQYGFGNSNPGQNMRGSSDILAAVDSHVTVERKRDKEECLLFKQTKSRQGEALKPFEISILSGPSGPSGFEYAGDYDEKKAKAEEVVTVLPDVLASGMKSRADIHDGLKEEFGKSAIDDGLKFGEESGLIERVPKEELPKGDRRKVYYRLLGALQTNLDGELPIFSSPTVIGKQEEELPNCDYDLEGVNAEADHEEDCGYEDYVPVS